MADPPVIVTAIPIDKTDEKKGFRVITPDGSTNFFPTKSEADKFAEIQNDRLNAAAAGLSPSDSSLSGGKNLYKDATGTFYSSVADKKSNHPFSGTSYTKQTRGSITFLEENQMEKGRIKSETGVFLASGLDTQEMDRGTLDDILKEIDQKDPQLTIAGKVVSYNDQFGNRVSKNLVSWTEGDINDGKFSGTLPTERTRTVYLDAEGNIISPDAFKQARGASELKVTTRDILVDDNSKKTMLEGGISGRSDQGFWKYSFGAQDVVWNGNKGWTDQSDNPVPALANVKGPKDEPPPNPTHQYMKYFETFNPNDKTITGVGYAQDGTIQYTSYRENINGEWVGDKFLIGRNGHWYEMGNNGKINPIDEMEVSAKISGQALVAKKDNADGLVIKEKIKSRNTKSLSRESFANWRIAIGQFQGFSGFTQFLPDGFVEDWREFLDKTYISKLLKRDYYASLICDAWLPSPGRDQNVVTLTSSSGAKEVIGGFPAGERSQVTYPNGSIDYIYKLTYAVRNPEGSGRKELRFNVFITKASQRFYLYRSFIPVKEGKKFIRGFVAATDGTDKDYLRGPVVGTSRFTFDQICLEFNPKVTIVGKKGDDEDVGQICNDIGTFTGPASAFDEMFGTSVAPGAAGSTGELSFDEAFPG
ncbi:hypothetical protein HYV84_05770 [Candidatus Woesearchaeota archaeon]|nr:hypothetical protein [Candidatus Woesearchaeota archaeon]